MTWKKNLFQKSINDVEDNDDDDDDEVNDIG